MKIMTRAVVISVLVIAIIGVAQAQFSRSEDAIEYRQAVMTLIAQHFGRIGAVIKGQIPYDRETVAKNAMLVETLSALPWEAFAVAGTDRGNTRLRSNAFSESDQFKQAAGKFEAAAAALSNAAKQGNLDDIKAPFGDVAQSCKGCHDQFRSR